MRKQKYYLAIDNYEYSVIIDSLNNLINKLIIDRRYTDAVDELIIKFAHTPIKKFKIKMTDVWKRLFLNRWRYIRTTGQLSHSLPYASDRRRKADRYLGTATSALSKNTPQNYIHQLAYKWQIKFVSFRYKQSS